MKKIKSFIIGVIFGSILVGGVSFAADKVQIKVTFPKIHYSFDGNLLSFGMSTHLNDGQIAPPTINYKGVNYVPIREMALALDKEVTWDATNQRVNMHSVQRPSFELLEMEDVPSDTQEWIKLSQHKQLAQVKIIDGDTYILVTLGKKSTGGHSVVVKEVLQYHNSTKVIVEITDPQKGDIVTEGVSYPFELAKLKGNLYGNMEFVDASGNMVPTLKGITYIPSVYRNSDDIVLFEPKISKNYITLHGIARSFEGMIVMSTVDADGRMLNYEVLQSKGSLPHWGYFRKTIQKKDITGSNAFLFHPYHGNTSEEEFIKLSENDLLN